MATYLEYVKSRDFGGFSPQKNGGKIEGFVFTLVAGQNNQEKEITFIHDVGILAADFPGTNVTTGDKISAYLRPTANAGQIGVVASSATSGQKVVQINPALPSTSIFRGLTIIFGGDATEYTVDSYDEDTGLITLYQNLATTKNIGVAIYLRIYVAKNYFITSERTEIFTQFFGSRTLPVGFSLILVYTLATVILIGSKDVPFNLYYFYGELE